MSASSFLLLVCSYSIPMEMVSHASNFFTVLCSRHFSLIIICLLRSDFCSISFFLSSCMSGVVLGCLRVDSLLSLPKDLDLDLFFLYWYPLLSMYSRLCFKNPSKETCYTSKETCYTSCSYTYLMAFFHRFFTTKCQVYDLKE